jgi:hypothetical protein
LLDVLELGGGGVLETLGGAALFLEPVLLGGEDVF